ncbi:hypothetical protein KFU94_57920 [Chloroflexi bacterium TSY]|nr:hypothetical protein [Chloroflexi bacterium TSY]
MSSIDVSPLILEAQPIAKAAATIYLKHTRSWLVGLISHGSALKGGFIPGCSDIDFQLYLTNSAFTNHGQLPLEIHLTIQRELTVIDPTPFRYVQCYAHGSQLPEDYVGPVPGAHHVVAGRLPIPTATAQELIESARSALDYLTPSGPTLLSHGGGRLERHVRLLCTKVWPTLYQVLALQIDAPIQIWCLPKPDAIDYLSEDTPCGAAIRRFYHAVLAYYPEENSVDKALSVIETGVHFLRAAKTWWSANQK